MKVTCAKCGTDVDVFTETTMCPTCRAKIKVSVNFENEMLKGFDHKESDFKNKSLLKG